MWLEPKLLRADDNDDDDDDDDEEEDFFFLTHTILRSITSKECINAGRYYALESLAD